LILYLNGENHKESYETDKAVRSVEFCDMDQASREEGFSSANGFDIISRLTDLIVSILLIL
jgi:hypothetical protein